MMCQGFKWAIGMSESNPAICQQTSMMFAELGIDGDEGSQKYTEDDVHKYVANKLNKRRKHRKQAGRSATDAERRFDKILTGKESEAEKKKRIQNSAGVEACHANIRGMVVETYPEFFQYSGGADNAKEVSKNDYVDFFRQDRVPGSMYYGHDDLGQELDHELKDCGKSRCGWNVGTITSLLMQSSKELGETATKMMKGAQVAKVMDECITGVVKVEYTGSLSFALGGNALDSFCGDGSVPVQVSWSKKKSTERVWQGGKCKIITDDGSETMVSFNANLGPISFSYAAPNKKNPTSGSVKFGLRVAKPESWEGWEKVLAYRETIAEVWDWMKFAYNALLDLSLGGANAFAVLAKWFADWVAAKITEVWDKAKAKIQAKVDAAKTAAQEKLCESIFGSKNYAKGNAIFKKIKDAMNKSPVEWIQFVGEKVFGVTITATKDESTGFDFEISWDGDSKEYKLSLADEEVTTLTAPPILITGGKISIKGVGASGTMNEFLYAGTG
jgi:hypothetical protein